MGSHLYTRKSYIYCIILTKNSNLLFQICNRVSLPLFYKNPDMLRKTDPRRIKSERPAHGIHQNKETMQQEQEKNRYNKVHAPVQPLLTHDSYKKLLQSQP